jgi:hypothetical protein
LYAALSFFNSPQETEENDFWDHSLVDTVDDDGDDDDDDDDVTLRNLIKTLMSPTDIILNVTHMQISDHSAFPNAL